MTLAVKSYGSGTPLVMLHGWGMNSGVWGSAVDTLSQHFEVLLVDLPGHGDSSSEAATNQLDDWVDAVLEVVPQEAVWLGWSLGGMVAQRAALKSPGRVKALMMVTSTPCFIRQHDWPAGLDKQGLEKFGEKLMGNTQKALLRYLGLQVRGASDERSTLKRLRESIIKSNPPSREALESGLYLLQHADLRDTLGELAMPTSWLFGEKDTLVPALTSIYIEKLLPRATRITIPSGGHAPFLSHPVVSETALEQLVAETLQGAVT